MKIQYWQLVETKFPIHQMPTLCEFFLTFSELRWKAYRISILLKEFKRTVGSLRLNKKAKKFPVHEIGFNARLPVELLECFLVRNIVPASVTSLQLTNNPSSQTAYSKISTLF
jgi:hypothetical protein